MPLETGGNEALSVVILRGTIPQEGPPAPAADAVPVRTTADGSLVEPFLDLGQVEHQPPPGTAIPADPTLEAFVHVLPEVRFVVDDQGAETPATEGADGDQRRASLNVGVPLEPGPHSLRGRKETTWAFRVRNRQVNRPEDAQVVSFRLLTVVLTTPEGEVSTSTARYSVEG